MLCGERSSWRLIWISVNMDSHDENLAHDLACCFQVFPTVEAIAWGGSQVHAAGDRLSDIDLYVYTTAVIPHQANLGYTTCFWHMLYHSQALYDRRGWLADLQQQSKQLYPEALRHAIIAKKHATLRRVIPS